MWENIENCLIKFNLQTNQTQLTEYHLYQSNFCIIQLKLIK